VTPADGVTIVDAQANSWTLGNRSAWKKASGDPHSRRRGSGRLGSQIGDADIGENADGDSPNSSTRSSGTDLDPDLSKSTVSEVLNYLSLL